MRSTEQLNDWICVLAHWFRLCCRYLLDCGESLRAERVSLADPSDPHSETAVMTPKECAVAAGHTEIAALIDGVAACRPIQQHVVALLLAKCEGVNARACQMPRGLWTQIFFFDGAQSSGCFLPARVCVVTRLVALVGP